MLIFASKRNPVKLFTGLCKICIFISCLLTSFLISQNLDRGTYVSFEKTYEYWNQLDFIVNPFSKHKNSINLVSDFPHWQNQFYDHISGTFKLESRKIRDLKMGYDPGIIDDTVLMFHRYKGNDLKIGAIYTIEKYIEFAFEDNLRKEFHKSFLKKLRNWDTNKNSSGQSLTLIKSKIGDTDVELNINGNIQFAGSVIFSDKELIQTSQKENKSWDLDINQKQQFNIDGRIADKWIISAVQNSESDFNWENDMKLQYEGGENDIFKYLEAGNISLRLPSTEFVSVGSGNSEGLFGIKAVNQIGPIEIQSIISKEESKASRVPWDGESKPVTLKDYQFVHDRFFYIDHVFKDNYFPLNSFSGHTVYENYVIGEYKLYKSFNEGDQGESGVEINAIAYINPSEPISSDSLITLWVEMEEFKDFNIYRDLGYVELMGVNSDEAVAIAYTIANRANGDYTNSTEFSSSTVFPDGSNIPIFKLVKDVGETLRTSATWPLMMKNIYDIQKRNVSKEGLKVEILYDQGSGTKLTSDENSGKTYLNLLGFDNRNDELIPVDGGDGKFDIIDLITIDREKGLLFFPYYLPFSYDSTGNFGNPNIELSELVKELKDIEKIGNGEFECDEEPCGPAMYFKSSSTSYTKENESRFEIVVTSTDRSNIISLDAFMVKEGSVQLKIDGRTLNEGSDYDVDYFMGKITLKSDEALDPTANIDISYEENEIISFDQRILAGTHLKYNLGEQNFLGGGLYFYNQSIPEDKVDIGNEPMRNFIWNINGKYKKEVDFITDWINYLPLINSSEPSSFTVEGEFAQVFPNPNPLGEAFIDDFEGSKRQTSIPINRKSWRMTAPPIDEFGNKKNINNRGKLNWYNPYSNIKTKKIWPEKSTSAQQKTDETKTLWFMTNYQGDNGIEPMWNGITTNLYSSEYDQSVSKYFDIWLNAEQIEDDELKIHIDLGIISEDINNNGGDPDTEDHKESSSFRGDGILSEGEDLGLDNCTNSYEDGWGGCLCEEYNSIIYDEDMTIEKIYDQSNEYCISGIKYSNASGDMINEYIDHHNYKNGDGETIIDPNGDDWSYEEGSIDDIDDSENQYKIYKKINGTESNRLDGISRPDSEDLDNNYSLRTENSYFTAELTPNSNSPFFVTETIDQETGPTGWKLFRIPLGSGFSPYGPNPDWTQIKSIRLWIESSASSIDNINHIGIAKMEIVRNEWKELGVASMDSLLFVSDSLFSIEVINSDENPEYQLPPGVEESVNKTYNTKEAEQSLVFSFENIGDDQAGGIGPDSLIAAVYEFGSSSGNYNSNSSESFFAYKNMEMFVFGGNPEFNSNDNSWPEPSENSKMELLFRLGKSCSGCTFNEWEEYYEIRQPIYYGWDEKNHINIDLDLLTTIKIPTLDNPGEQLNDTGSDGCIDAYEDGNGGCLETFLFSYFCREDYSGDLTPSDYINVSRCNELLSETIFSDNWDPNQDNWVDSNGNELWDLGEGEEGNGNADELEPAIIDYDGNGYLSNLEQYDPEKDIFIWDSKNQISNVCNHCTEVHIKGDPAIDDIQLIMVGIANKTENTVFGKVLLDELRMTNVKKDNGKAFRFKTAFSIADILDVSTNYKREDADFHRLQQRLGTGSTNETYSASFKLYPHSLLPGKWGLKFPLNFGISSSHSLRKRINGTDILNKEFSEAPDSLKTINEKLSFSTKFSKISKSNHWLLKRTIDNIVIDFSGIYTYKSSPTLRYDNNYNFQTTASYNYTFSKENYFNPFIFLNNIPIIKTMVSDFRLYYSPSKITASSSISENKRDTEQRSGSYTESYNMNLKRNFSFNYEIIKNLKTSFSKIVESNLNEDFENKMNDISFKNSNIWSAVKKFSPGLVKKIDEQYSATYSLDKIHWLKPTIKYIPKYSWSLNQIDQSVPMSNISSNNSFKASASFSTQGFFEIFYKPQTGRSSNNRRNNRSSSRNVNSGNGLLKIKNETLKSVFDQVHKLSGMLRTISLTYDRTFSHNYSNLLNYDEEGDLFFIDYWFRLGLSDTTKSNMNYSDSFIPTESHSYKNLGKLSSSLNITKNILLSVDYNQDISKNVSSSSNPSISRKIPFFPKGDSGDEGFKIVNWSLTFNGLEKYFFQKYFKDITISHVFNGDRTESYNDNLNNETLNWWDWGKELENDYVYKTKDYTRSFSPFIKISTRTKGRQPVTMNISYNNSLTIDNNLSAGAKTTTRSLKDNITSTVQFTKKGGLNIPIFFFRDFYIDNDITFNLQTSWSKQVDKKRQNELQNFEDILPFTDTESLRFNPTITYSFTKWIEGTILYSYEQTYNRRTGMNKKSNIGFTVNVKIQG